MADQLQLRGGTTAEHSTFTGALREVTVDTDKDVLVVHDNATAGGHPLMAEDGSNSALALGTVGTPSLKFTGDTNTGVFSPGADQLAVSTAGVERVEFGSSEVVFNDGGADYNLRVEGDTNANLIVVDASADSIGIGTDTPGTLIEIDNAAPYVTLKNNTQEDTDGGRESRLIFEGEQTGGEISTLAQIEVSHDGTGDDQQGKLVISTNDGSDGAAPTAAVTIDSSQRVGLGTSSPQNLIHAHTASSNTNAIQLTNSTTGVGAGDGMQIVTSDSEMQIRNRENGVLNFWTNNTKAVTIDASQRVGIGTTSPGATLHVQGSGDEIFRINTTNAGGPYCAFQTNGTNFLFLGSAAQLASGGATDSCIRSQNNLILTSGGATERARIDSSGRLLVGTSSYSGAEKLVVQGTSTNANGAGMLRLQLGSTPAASTTDIGYVFFGDNAGNYGARILSQSEAAWSSGSSHPSRLTFSTTASGASSPTERMRIASTGQLSTFDSSGFGHVIESSRPANTSNHLIFGRQGSSDVNGTGGTHVFSVYTNGNVVNTNNSYGSLSDIKLKENIVDASSQWDDLKAIQVRNYNFKEGQTHTQIGVVAQEVELVSPGLVSESPDRDEDGNDLGTVTKSVNYSVLYMKAVKALQEAMERIETLEAKVAALEAN